MIVKRKNSLQKKRFYTVISASVLVFLIIAYASVNAIIGALSSSSESGSDSDNTTLPEIIEGESLYGQYPIAYPYFNQDSVQSLDVSYYDEEGVKNFFSVRRPSEKADFIFYFSDTDGNAVEYMPPIYTAEDRDFDYTDFYAVSSLSGYNVYKLTYLFVAVGVLYFDERIELAPSGDERERQLNRYGLGEQDRQSISVSYKDADGKTQTHVISIGDKAIDGSGYYFTVDDRNYVYNSRTTDFDYALDGFVGFLHSRLVAAGLPGDQTYEPYFTTDLKQWKNTLHNTEGEIVPDGSTLIFTGNTVTPVYNSNLTDYPSGYFEGKRNQLTFKLNDLAPENIKNAFVGKALGALASPLSVTSVHNTNWASLNATYEYQITAIEAILTNGADITEEGTLVGDSRYIKVTYDYTVTNGESTESYTSAHAVIDLQNPDTGIPSWVIDTLKTRKIGVAGTGIRFSVTYTEENSYRYDVKYVIDEIVAIYERLENGTVKQIDKITDKAIVSYKYSFITSEGVLESKGDTIDLSLIPVTDTTNYAIKQSLIGKGVGSKLNLEVYEETLWCQYFESFSTYNAESLDFFVTEEMIVSLKYVNPTERDPFYGESVYINTLKNKYRSYALDATKCEVVIRLLGGLDGESSSYVSPGLQGTETVAVGLTPANMLKYGLYANTIYFELPRELIKSSTSDPDSFDDYNHLNTLGFNLYISDVQPDGTRYVGSDMYEIIAKVSAYKLEFLDKSFTEYWARETLAAVNYTDITEMTLDFYMSDLHGSYDMDIEHNTVYLYNGYAYATQPEVDGKKVGQKYDNIVVNVTPIGSNATESVLTRELRASGLSSMRLCTVYQRAMGADEVPMGVYDSLGTDNFKSVLSIIFNTYYTGGLTAEEQAQGFADGELVMKFSFTVPGSTIYPYVYEFYRIDDRRVMVSIYNQDTQGNALNRVSDFYVSTFAFKKIARSFNALLNGQTVNEDEGYPS